jgi:hypothetical protein
MLKQWAAARQVAMQVQSDDLEELRRRLRALRAYIALLKNPALNDLDALLSVAEAEVERAIGDRKPV